ncbi:hypothetical protein [Bradyrhizobium erythrophlei]|uniref:hypothetical protein n=1 Tax=Bradyrhizobium erythrophlei TaxID=1437360 RepID=UPI0015618013|nr:hypothetical protein [Bradyrhizobium erythrophlei]
MHTIVAFIAAFALVVLAILQARSVPDASPAGRRDFVTVVIIATIVTMGYAF